MGDSRDVGEAGGAVEGQRALGEGVRRRSRHQRSFAFVVEMAPGEGRDRALRETTAHATPESTVRGYATPVAMSPMTFDEMSAPVARDAFEVVLPSTVQACVRPRFDDTMLGVLKRRR